MTDQNGTTSAPECASPNQIADPNNYEEPAEYALRRQLGLRPVFYPSTTGDSEHKHPDSHPCPPWCAIGNLGYQHEVDPKYVLMAEHSTDAISTVASKFTGEVQQSGAVVPATWETVLSGYHAARNPTITVNLRHWNGGEGQKYVERMRLSINDAADLVTVLQYLIAQADAAEALR